MGLTVDGRWDRNKLIGLIEGCKEWMPGEAVTKRDLMRKMLSVAKICVREKNYDEKMKGKEGGKEGGETNQKVQSWRKLKGTREKLDVEGRRTT